MILRCGVATRAITPTQPVYLHGYADRDRLSRGIAEPLELGCLALDDDSRRLLIVACDMIGMEAPVCEELYALLERETGIGYPAIMLSCSHTHFAPALHEDRSDSPAAAAFLPEPRFAAAFRARLVEAAHEALADLSPATLQVARLASPQVAFNRRTARADGTVQTNYRYPLDAREYTFSPIDDELTVLRFVDGERIRAGLVNFGCHPVTGGAQAQEDHYRVSADYPHYLRRTIGDRWSSPLLFTLGAAGDAVPIDRYGDSRQRLGLVLGHTATLAERVYAAEESVSLDSWHTEMRVDTILRADVSTVEKDHRRARGRYEDLQGAAAGAEDTQSQRLRAAALQEYRRCRALAHRARLYPDNGFTVRIQFLRIGGTVLVGLPFEVLSETALRMKARHPRSVLVSCAGGYQGYLPLEHEYARGGYEASPLSTHFVPGTGDRLLEAILRELDGRAGIA